MLAAIQLQVKAALNYDKLLAKLRNSEGERSIRDQQNALITSLNLKLSGISKKRTRLYEDFTEGILDEEEYAFAKKAYDEQYADLSRRLDEAVQRKVKFAEAMSEDNKWLTLMKSVSGAAKLSQELIDESVELVKVHKDGYNRAGHEIRRYLRSDRSEYQESTGGDVNEQGIQHRHLHPPLNG